MLRFATTVFLLISIYCYGVMPALAGEFSAKVYPLRHQMAEDLLPTLNGVLKADETINAYNNELIVNASPATQNTIEQLLSQLDKPLHNLLISVRNNESGEMQDNSNGISGGIRTGQVYLGTNQPTSNGNDLTVRSNGVQVQTRREVRHISTQQAQQIRVVEGRPAWISTGQNLPSRSYDRWGNPVTEYRNADQGFFVTARVVGNRVALDISTSNDKLSDNAQLRRRGVIDTNHLRTSTSGEIGEWINLGGITTSSDSSSNSYTTSSSGANSRIGNISVRIVPAD